jgi:predicted nucleotidyltransferase
MGDLHEILRTALKAFPAIRLCLVFGSMALGKSTSASDLDIAVAAEQPLAPETRLEVIEAVSGAVRHEVDLVDLMADTGPILKQALSQGTIVQNKDKLLYARLITRMLFTEADMMPYYHRILRERRERFLHG